MANEKETVTEELGDPSVPAELLEIHLELEDKGVSPEEFREVFGS